MSPHSSTRPPTPEPLTFGVELEFLLDPHHGPYGPPCEPPINPANPEDWENLAPGNDPDSRRIDIATRHIAVHLRAHGIPALSTSELTRLQNAGPADAAFARRFPSPGARASPRTRWSAYATVRGERSVHDERPGRGWVPLEVSTRVLDFSPDGLARAGRVADVLLGVGGAAAFGVRTNASCGLHVHVGRGDDGLAPPWLGRVAALAWAASPLLDQLHPPARGPARHRGPCRGLRVFSALAHDADLMRGPELPGRRGPVLAVRRHAEPDAGGGLPACCGAATPPSVRRALRATGTAGTWVCDRWAGALGARALLEARGTAAVLARVRAHSMPAGALVEERLAYHFGLLAGQHDGGSAVQRTVEFRQHAGSLDAVEIGHWVCVVCSLVGLGRDEEGGRYGYVLGRVTRGEVERDYGVLDFLRDIGCGAQAEYYAEQREREERGLLEGQQDGFLR